MPKKISNAKIACLDFSLQKFKSLLGVQVSYFSISSIRNSFLRNINFFLFSRLGINNRSRKVGRSENVMKILAAGTNVALVTGEVRELMIRV